jgi:anthranilate synthase component 1
MSFRATIDGPVDLFALHRQNPEIYPFLLQSVAGHPQSGRYDILFGFPGPATVLDRAGSSPNQADFFSGLSADFLSAASSEDADLPFSGGWFLLVGYEAARLVEPGLHLPASPYRLPDAIAVRCPVAAIHDRELQQTHLISERDPAAFDQLKSDLMFNINKSLEIIENKIINKIKEDPEESFLDGARKVLDYLRAGDIFQANLSRNWSADLRGQASYLDVYSRMRDNNPAPFAGLACWGASAVLSSSPERLVNIDIDRQVQTRPIAGTRPRGAGSASDQMLREKLISSLKERAEHIMLIDLERNDLGRICVPGSLTVNELMTVESYAHVHHIVSNVRGHLRPDATPGDVFRAVFPGGTITGCPKVRAMEIIAELEGVGRGPYTGSMGYLSRCGRMDTNILIRSLICEDGQINFRAGAGIVADSVPETELLETRSKARGILLALGAVVRS